MSGEPRLSREEIFLHDVVEYDGTQPDARSWRRGWRVDEQAPCCKLGQRAK